MENAVQELNSGNPTEAVDMLKLARRSSGITVDLRYEILGLLAEAEFRLGNYGLCLDAGREMQSDRQEKSQVSCVQCH